MLSKGLSFAPTYLGNKFQTKVDLFRFYRSLHLKVWYHHKSSSAVITNVKEPEISSPFVQSPLSFPINNNPTLNTFTKKCLLRWKEFFRPKELVSTILQKAKKMHWTGYPPEIIKVLTKEVWCVYGVRTNIERKLSDN